MCHNHTSEASESIGAPGSGPIILENICLDFEHKSARYLAPLTAMLGSLREQLMLLDPFNPVAEFIERIWPNDLPGSLIMSRADFDGFLRVNLRPPVDGPKADSFAAAGGTIALTAYWRQGHSSWTALRWWTISPHERSRGMSPARCTRPSTACG